MLKPSFRYGFHYSQSVTGWITYFLKTRKYFIKQCYKTRFSAQNACRFPGNPYLCIVFFIVLDLRLTKVGVQRYSFFYAQKYRVVLPSQAKNIHIYFKLKQNAYICTYKSNIIYKP